MNFIDRLNKREKIRSNENDVNKLESNSKLQKNHRNTLKYERKLHVTWDWEGNTIEWLVWSFLACQIASSLKLSTLFLSVVLYIYTTEHSICLWFSFFLLWMWIFWRKGYSIQKWNVWVRKCKPLEIQDFNIDCF